MLPTPCTFKRIDSRGLTNAASVWSLAQVNQHALAIEMITRHASSGSLELYVQTGNHREPSEGMQRLKVAAPVGVKLTTLTTGCRVSKLVGGEGAALAGVKLHDTILAVNGTPVYMLIA